MASVRTCRISGNLRISRSLQVCARRFMCGICGCCAGLIRRFMTFIRISLQAGRRRTLISYLGKRSGIWLTACLCFAFHMRNCSGHATMGNLIMNLCGGSHARCIWQGGSVGRHAGICISVTAGRSLYRGIWRDRLLLCPRPYVSGASARVGSIGISLCVGIWKCVRHVSVSCLCSSAVQAIGRV